jgi:quercetin dioxygenase-like cupin family protein
MLTKTNPPQMARNAAPSSSSVEQLQKLASQLPQLTLETFSHFAPGLYARQLLLPAGATIVGKRHKKEHIYIVTRGRVAVDSGSGAVIHEAGSVHVSQPGAKRAIHALEDAIFTTVHRTDNTDLDDIERELLEEDDTALFDSSNQLKFDVPKFREHTKRVIAGEKPGFWSDWTEEQQVLYTSGDWRAFSESRGYSPEAIAEYSEWMDRIAQARAAGVNALAFIHDLATAAALANIKQDKRGEILKSSHAPFENRGGQS